MKALLITLSSMTLTAFVLGNAYYQKKQFYPSVVYLTKSNPSMAVIYLQAFVFVLLMGKFMRKVFFGQLRAAEMEHLIERSWYAVTETCLAFTVFRDDLSPKFVALFTLLLFLKCFHWLAEDRVDYMERSPNISIMFHIRITSLLLLLGSLDFVFVKLAYQSTLTKGASVQLVFGFEYAILLTVIFNIFMKYLLHVVDLHRENPWEDKAVYLLYTELVMGFLKVILYLTFITIMMKIHTFPLFAIRPMYLSMRHFKKALSDVIMSRRAIRNMNNLYPNATPEELQSADNVCIICREEMTGNGSSKKLPCNHIFHVSCLRSWFQRQQTCPTCRMDILRTPAPASPREQQQPRPPAPPPPAQQAGQPQIAVPPNWQPMFANFANILQQNQQQPQQQAQETNSNQQPGVQSNPTPATSSTSQNPTNAGQNQLPPMFGFPPFVPFLTPLPPMPQSTDLSNLSVEELATMEGNERKHIESRIKCLENIRTLLDAAAIQLQQYNSIARRFPTNQTTDSTARPQEDANHTNSPSTSNAMPSTSSTPQAEIRRRRLERFSQTQPPVIDSNTNTVIASNSQSYCNSTDQIPSAENKCDRTEPSSSSSRSRKTAANLDDISNAEMKKE